MSDLLSAFDDLTNRLRGRLEARAVDLVAQRLAPRHQARFLSGLTSEADRDEVRILVRGAVPVMLDQGFGPGGRGTTGPVDMRQFVLRNGKRRQAIPVAPGVFRMMSLNGKPWIHPGFPRGGILEALQRDILKVLKETHHAR